MADMTGRLCVVTGANSGIGKATALGLARLNAHVIMVCRNEQRGTAAQREIVAATENDHVSLLLADMSSQQSIRQLAESYRARFDRVDVLVHSAGALFFKRELSADGIELNLATNYLGAFLLTNLLMNELRAADSARVICVSGEYHRKVSADFDDLQGERKFSGITAAAQATLAKILFTNELSRRVAGDNITANSLHPGAVRTNLTKGLPWYLRPIAAVGSLFFSSPEKGARTPVYLASSPEVASVTGKYFIDCKPVDSSPESNDPDVAARMWRVSEQLTGLASRA